jgi:Ca2+-binding RTX toxin-like protein
VSRFTPRRLTVLLAGAALAAGTVGLSAPAHAAYEDATMNLPRDTSGTPGLGPHFPYVQAIPIGGVVPLKNQAIINRTTNGWLFRAGQQDSHLTVTQTNGRLQFEDTGTQSWKWLPKHCQQLDVAQGVGASCPIPARFTTAAPMLVEIWPRLGNDYVDTSALSSLFDVSVLGDRGDEVVHLGAGNNFVNGAQDADTVYGGDGNDWIRTATGDDYIDGGGGNDYLVGVDNNDTIYGGPGDDSIYGSGGNDDLFSGAGNDHVVCGDGSDTATVKSTDRTSQCENESYF